MSSLFVVSHIAQWAVIVFTLVSVWAIVRQIGLLHRRIAPVGARMSGVGLEVGEPAPRFEATDIHGRPVQGPARDRLTLLVFVSPGCPACGELMPAVRSIVRSERQHLDVVLIDVAATQAAEAREYVNQHRLEHLPYVAAGAIGELYKVATPPYAILIGTDTRVVAKGLVNHLEHLDSLLAAERLGHPSLESYVADGTAIRAEHQGATL